MTPAQRRAYTAVEAHADTCPRLGAPPAARIAWHVRLLELYADMWVVFDTPQPIRDDVTARHARAITNLRGLPERSHR